MRILILGDGAALNSGFARVIRHAAGEFVRRGWDVGQIAAFDTPPFCDAQQYRDLGITPFFPSTTDLIGRDILPLVMDRFKPDVVFINKDPGTAVSWYMGSLQPYLATTPTVLYAPIEGAPIHGLAADAFSAATSAVTYTQWSSDALKREHGLTVPYVYHGVNRDDFPPLSAEDRESIRDALNWTGTFVVTYIARNAARKNHERLLRAMQLILQNDPETPIRLYLHTTPYDGHSLQGWNLPFVAHVCGVTDYVQFGSPRSPVRGEPQTSVAQKLAASDLYIHPAAVEGFGLPIIEAMSAGVPVVVTNDSGNMREIAGDGAVAYLEPADLQIWFNGATLYNPAPEAIARTLFELAKPENVHYLEAARERAYTRLDRFSWGAMSTLLADEVERVAKVATPEAHVVDLSST